MNAVDAPRAMVAHGKAISRVCIALVVIALVEQGWETVATVRGSLSESGDGVELNPWIGIALGFLSAAAIGLDAMVVGVRRRRGVGPSIGNLAPGGWAMFAAMMWIVAIPAYFFGVRRRARREGAEVAESVDGVEEGIDDPSMRVPVPVTVGDWVAIAIPFVIGVFATFAAFVAP